MRDFKSDEFPATVRVYRERANEFVTKKVKVHRRGELVSVIIPRDDQVSYETREGATFKKVIATTTIEVRQMKGHR